MFRRKIVTKIYCGIIAGSMLWSAPCLAGPQIPGFYGKVPNLTPPAPTAVPQLKGIVQGVTNVVHDQAQNKLTVNQDKDKAILDWHSFDIGEQAWTHFNQQGNKDWAALNRIYAQNPSQIYGRLTADGRVYLINQNGILFGPGSRVNVHSLIGSSLNLKDDDFLNGALKFKAENYNNPSEPVNANIAVSNHGLIETDEAGEVFLLAPHVENSGDIITPIGQIGLAAGSEVEIKPWTPPVGGSSTDVRSALLVGVERSGAGLVENLEGGWLVADLGLAGMYGRVVNQEGVIRSVTAVKKQGEIELLASEKISTGPRSVTSAEVSTSQEKVNQTFQFKPGRIKVRGLNPDPYSTEATGAIEHRGIMEAPSGTVTMLASDYVFLEKDSRIDVSGKWVNSTAEGNLVESQLNSVQLRDDYGQKEGLLKGQKVKFDAYLGSAIGDVSGALGAVEVTALEQATKGGSAEIWAANGNIVMKDGAQIDFSGGGIRYSEGHTDTTKLLSGRQVIDISDAPQWIAYDRIMGLHQTFHARYGVKEEFRGLFTGGANALRNSSGERVEGKDAGSLTLVAGRLVLDGVLDGSATKGLYQTENTELLSDLGNQKTRGRKEPKAGSLLLGYPDASGSTILRDYILGDVRIQAHAEPLPNGFLPGDPLPGSGSSVSTLSAGFFTAAGLSSLMIYSNLGITIEEEARISLTPGGTFRASSRAIELRGEVSVPAGQISLSTSENKTSDAASPGYISLVGDGNIFLAGTSRLLAGGQRIDSFLAGKDTSTVLEPGRLEGGSVSLGGGWFDTHGIVMKKGALIDVSGGYLIDAKGGVTGGNAGSASLLAPTLIMEGDLFGHSLVDKKGGTLILRASRSSVVLHAPPAPAHLDFGSPLPADLAGTLQLGKAQIEATGFTGIEVSSVYDLTVNQGVHFSPSRVNLATPVPLLGRVSVGTVRNNVTGAVSPSEGAGGLLNTDLVNIGASSITLRAGVDLTEGFSANDASLLDIQPAAALTVGPAGTITMDAPAISVAGTLNAPGGRLDLRARQFDLILKSSATLNAKGYNKPEAKPVMAGYPLGYTPLTGGEVKLESTFGNLILEHGASVDVSGSEPVETFVKSASGSPEAFTVASDPGSVTLSFLNRLDLGGQLIARASLAGLRGGSLTVSKRDPSQGLDVSSADLALFESQGFDGLAFQSKKGLNFTGTMEIPIGRSLTLDAPEIRAASGSAVTLSAPWVRIANDPSKYAANDNAYTLIPPAATVGSSQLAFRGLWIDIEGSVVLSGFSTIRLEAGQDIRMSDRFYTGSVPRWEGKLKAAGDLEMSAGRIYPTTLAAFVVDAADQVTILPGEGATDGFIPSAGGSLLIEANAIDHRGLLAAPLGSIELKGKGAESRIDLDAGSLISTAGSTAINVGALNGDFWQVPDRPTDTQLVDLSQSPRKSIKISADTVTFREGGALDVSGGGSIFTYQFLPSPEGSSHPLEKTGRYVILPDNSVRLPGEGVYLEAGAGLASGTYSLLPAQYAFLPGALILTDLSKAGQSYVVDQERSLEGYPLVKGYSAVVGTDIRSPKPKGFSVRQAKEVLREGFFDFRQIVAGEAGTITVAGKTTLLDGVLKARALPGYQGGSISLSSDRITVGQGAPVPGTLVLNPDALKGMDLEQINLGYDPGAATLQDRITAASVTIEGGTVLTASTITLGGKQEIVLKSGAEIHAISDAGNGVVSLISPEGKVTIEEQTLVHASDRMHLEVQDMDLRGDIRVDDSGISLAGAKVFFVPDGFSRTEPGLYLTQASWNDFSRFEEIGLKSGSDLLFLGDFNLNVKDSLTIDAARIAAVPVSQGGPNNWNVNISAPKISLLNSGTASTNDTSADTAGITLSAADLVIGHGDIRFDGFGQVNLASGSDLTFKGKGSLTTAGADLTITAPRVTTSFYQDDKTSYEVARYTVSAGRKAVTLSTAQGTPGQSSVPGGMLELLARTIDVSTTVEVNSGTIRMAASGSGAGEGVFVRKGAKLLARGSEYAPGGSLELRSGEGAVSVSAGALLDVSAGTQGDAGTVSLHAPAGGVALEGTLLGKEAGGQGGSFEMDTARISDFSSLNASLGSGGFTQLIDLRARTGNVTIGSGQRVSSREFRLVVDQGNLSVYGELDAPGISGGGIVDLYTGNILTLYPDAKILALGTGAGAPGGDVLLGTSSGYISTLAGSLIDVSGGEGGVGGTLSLRAPRFESGSVKEVLILPFGKVKGARDVFVEAFKVYSHTGDRTVTSDDFGTSTASGWWKETDAYMTGAAAIETRLLSTMVREGWTEDRFHLLPGIEVRSTGNLTLTGDWNLTPWRFAGEPGVLTLRSGGHLTLAANLTDKNSDSPAPGGRDSWALNLVCGGVISSADPLRTSAGAGTLTVSAQKLVYTESAPLRFTSGGDMVIEQALLNFQGFSPWTPFLNMPGSLGTFDSLIQGSVAGNLTLKGSAILSATGEVDILVGKNLDLDQKGWHSAIATFGLRTGDKTYARSGGGDIVLRVGGDVRTRNADTQDEIDLTTVPWDFGYKIRVGSSTYYDWGASFIIPEREALSPRPTLSTRGIAAMGGGDVRITVGGDFRAVAGSFGHALYARGSANPALTPATIFGGGDLLVSAGGDVTGRFLVTKGKGEINAMGALGSADEKRRSLLEGFDARLAATAQGAAYVGAVVNPGLVEKSYKTQARVLYTEDSAVQISSSRGDVILYGDSPYHEAGTGEKVLPGTLEIVAGKNLLLLSDFALVPSRTGNLKLVAGLNIEAGLAERQARLERKLVMSDMAPSDIYGSYKPQLLGDLFGSTVFSPVPVHGSDPHPIEIAAGQDILQLKLFLPKQADILAGRDIRDLFLRGQNLADDDVTNIRAKGDILFSTDPRGAGASRDRDSGFEIGGPGIFAVQAGGLIDLGNAENGLRTVGGFYNSGLGEKGASLMVVTGAAGDLIPDAVATFFSDLRKAGTEYSDLLAKGDRQGAQKKIDETRTVTIEPFLDKLSMEEGGNILMVNSQISTLSGKDDIFILASGRLDVGKSTFFTAEQERQSTGIFSAGGGAISVFTVGDLNVNESRVMSFRGGDITIWSDRGSVNAGRGDKTAISASPPRQVQIEGISTPETTDDKYQLRFDPPSVGSGIRTLTYDPDGIEGLLKEPLAGDVYLFAPTGIIDAGEAGIAGRNVILGATEIVNAQNISFSVGSVGVPVASTGAVGIGALAGVSSLTEVGKMTEQAAGMAGSRAEAAQQAAKMMEEFTAKWVDVKVIGFE